MAWVRERFRDARPEDEGGLPEYIFAVNHSEEDGEARTYDVRRTATTGGTTFVRQVGESSPRVLRYSGVIFDPSQYDAMLDYFKASRTRTVFFREYTGEEHEVIVTGFNPMRVYTVRNPRHPSLTHYWRYDIEMEVIA